MQVQTKLENPTRYHVIEKQKSQVRQYLSESFQQPNEVSSLLSAHTHSQGHHSHPGTNIMGVPYNPNLQAHNQNLIYQNQSINPQVHGYSHNQSQGQSLNHCNGQNLNQNQGHNLNSQGQSLKPSPGKNLNHQNNHNHNMQNQSQSSTPVSFMGTKQYTGPSVSPDAAAMSPSLSSVATSASEVRKLISDSLSISSNKLYGDYKIV